MENVREIQRSVGNPECNWVNAWQRGKVTGTSREERGRQRQGAGGMLKATPTLSYSGILLPGYQAAGNSICRGRIYRTGIAKCYKAASLPYLPHAPFENPVSQSTTLEGRQGSECGRSWKHLQNSKFLHGGEEGRCLQLPTYLHF